MIAEYSEESRYDAATHQTRLIALVELELVHRSPFKGGRQTPNSNHSDLCVLCASPVKFLAPRCAKERIFPPSPSITLAIQHLRNGIRRAANNFKSIPLRTSAYLCARLPAVHRSPLMEDVLRSFQISFLEIHLRGPVCNMKDQFMDL